jgi:DeoR/GlpR family transcriptional regulator of sugar metabolism
VYHRAMLTQQRKRLVLDRLRKDGRIVAKDLSQELSLSEDTIRRDLRELAQAGLLTRVHGGALPASPTVARLSDRRNMSADAKVLLARAGAKLLKPGLSVFIDGGTTNLELVRHLALDLRLSIVTHSPTIAAALEFHDNIGVRLIGGTILRHSMVTTGAAALEQIQAQRFDMCFIGMTGLHPDEGLTTGDFEECLIKRAIISRSGETVALMTAEKIGAISAHTIVPCSSLAILVVTKDAALGDDERYRHMSVVRV